MKRIYQLLAIGLVMSATVFFTGCTQDEQVLPNDSQSIETRGLTGTLVPRSATMYGLTDAGELVKVTTSPFTVGTPVPIIAKGTREGVGIRAIDYRPGTTRLYGVGGDNILYLIDPVSGEASPVSITATPFSPGISGAMVGFDYNSADNTLRIVTDADQNMRISAMTGQVVGVDQNVRPTQMSVTAIAYGSSTSGFSGTSTSLYALEATTSRLYRMNGALGSISSVGPLGVNIKGEAGFDIGYRGGAWAVFFGGNSSGGPDGTGTADDHYLFSINTGTGAARVAGRVPRLIGIAVQ